MARSENCGFGLPPPKHGVTTDTSERGLERLICTRLALRCRAGEAGLEDSLPTPSGGAGWICGAPKAASTVTHLRLPRRNADAFEGLRLEDDGPASSWPASRARSASAVSSTCSARGSKTGRSTSRYGTPSPGKVAAEDRFSVTRQLRYSRDESQPTVHQRPAGCHVPAEEQPHQADGRGRSSTSVTAIPHETLRDRPAVWRTSRWTTKVQFCTEGKSLLVPARRRASRRRATPRRARRHLRPHRRASGGRAAARDRPRAGEPRCRGSCRRLAGCRQGTGHRKRDARRLVLPLA